MRPETLSDYAMMHSTYLVEKARDGDDQAFNKLVGIWFKRIYNFAFKYFGDHDEAMESTQKTFLSVYKNLNKLQQTSSFKSWLYRIAYNQFNEEKRREKRKKLFSIFNSESEQVMSIEDEVHKPEEDFRNKELAEVLKHCLKMLPEEQRTIVIMKEYEGFKFREIAEALEISENTAKSRLYYGLKGLRKMMIEKNITSETI